MSHFVWFSLFSQLPSIIPSYRLPTEAESWPALSAAAPPFSPASAPSLTTSPTSPSSSTPPPSRASRPPNPSPHSNGRSGKRSSSIHVLDSLPPPSTFTSDLIDIGLNLSHKQFDEDRDDVIQRAVGQKVTHMVRYLSLQPLVPP